MTSKKIRASRVMGPTALLLAVSVFCSAAGMGPVPVQDDIYGLWEEVGLLRARGDYAVAVQLLERIISDYPGDDAVQRRAWNLLVHTHFKMNDEEGAMKTAREALARYPDLSVNTAILPQSMNETYRELRSAMYGSLEITGPGGAALFLDGDSLGVAPMNLAYVRTGQYSLMAVKSGFHSMVDTIRIDPSATLTMGIAMERRRDKKWWLYRIGPVIAAGIVAAFTLGSDSGGGVPVEEPLPGPPAPPGQ